MNLEQQIAVDKLREAMADFALAINECSQAGLEPAEAFRACGVEIPGFAIPLVNSTLAGLIVAENAG